MGVPSFMCDYTLNWTPLGQMLLKLDAAFVVGARMCKTIDCSKGRERLTGQNV